MLSAIRPLLTETIDHWLAPARSIYGKAAKTQSTSHAARVIHMAGESLMPASREKMADDRAVVWLIDHPRRIAAGDTFELATGEVLTVARAELRVMPGGTLSKVYLK
jgi:hypothetical protein